MHTGYSALFFLVLIAILFACTSACLLPFCILAVSAFPRLCTDHIMAAMDGSLNNRVTCAHSNMRSCWIVYDLGPLAVHKVPSRLEYFQCTQPGFTNGGVKDFQLEVSDALDGPWEVVIKGTANEADSKADRGGQVQSYSTPEDKSSTGGRYWRFHAINDHGNGSYRWFCEIRLCKSRCLLLLFLFPDFYVPFPLHILAIAKSSCS